MLDPDPYQMNPDPKHWKTPRRAISTIEKMAGYSHPSPGPCEPGAPWGWRALWSPGSPAAAPPTITHTCQQTYINTQLLTGTVTFCSRPGSGSGSLYLLLKLNEISMQNKILIIVFLEQNFLYSSQMSTVLWLLNHLLSVNTDVNVLTVIGKKNDFFNLKAHSKNLKKSKIQIRTLNTVVRIRGY